MGGMGAALSGAASAIGSGAKALYGDEKNMMQTGQPQAQGNDPTMAQQLLFGQQGQQPQGPTPAQQLRRNTLANY
jgi:hypothetical protein